MTSHPLLDLTISEHKELQKVLHVYCVCIYLYRATLFSFSDFHLPEISNFGTDVIRIDVGGVQTNLIFIETVDPRLNADILCERLSQVRRKMMVTGS